MPKGGLRWAQAQAQAGVVWDEGGIGVTTPAGAHASPAQRGARPQASSPCRSPRSPSAGWWTSSPGAGWPAKAKPVSLSGRPPLWQGPPARPPWGPSQPLTFMRSVQELRILWEGGGGERDRMTDLQCGPRTPVWGGEGQGAGQASGLLYGPAGA